MGSAFETSTQEKRRTSTLKPQPQHHLNSPSTGKTLNERAKIGPKLAQKQQREPTDSPDEPKAPQQVAERAHRWPRQAKGTQQDDTSTPKKRQKLQKVAKGTPKASKKHAQNDKKTRINFQKQRFTCMGARF